MPGPPLNANTNNFKAIVRPVNIPEAIRKYIKCDGIYLSMKYNRLFPDHIMDVPRLRPCRFERTRYRPSRTL